MTTLLLGVTLARLKIDHDCLLQTVALRRLNYTDRRGVQRDGWGHRQPLPKATQSVADALPRQSRSLW